MTTVPTDVAAVVSDGAGRVRLADLSLAGASGWLRVESSAICGTDVRLHHGGLSNSAVLGHHVIGVVEHITLELGEQLGVVAGDRVAVEEYLGCGACDDCLEGSYRFCAQADLWTGGQRVGMIPVGVSTGLHGGNAEFLELTPRHVLHRVPPSLATNLAAWVLPLANAIDWVVATGGTRPGSRVAVIGPGYHGIACVAAAQYIGASQVHLFGLQRDAERLAVAEKLDARTHVVSETVGEEVDVVIDTVGSRETLSLGTRLLARRGTLVLAGLAGGHEVALDSTAVVRRLLQIKGVRGRAPASVSRSIQALHDGVPGLDSVATHYIGLHEVGSMLGRLSRNEGPASPHVVVDPWIPRAVANPIESEEASL